MANYLVITGASRGIGLAVAELFLQHQYKVINLSRTACDVENVDNVTVDLTTTDWGSTVVPLLQQKLSDAKSICLVHNAAVFCNDTVQHAPAEQLQQVMQLNVIAPMLLNQYLLPLMQPSSSIIYIGSTLSEIAVKNAASYCTSKHAVAGLMRATCQDLDNTGIHTCCVCPGVTETEMLQQRLKEEPHLQASLTSLSAAKRFVQPDELAAYIWFCSQNPVINGALLHANLGQINR